MKFDVVIVGAGPAGSTAAKYLAEKGVNILLIDKSTFPRDKPCAGSLPVRALERFPYIKNTDLIDSYSYGGYAYYSTLKYKAEFQRNEPVTAMIRREKFDHGLVNLATERGATLIEGKSVEDMKLSKDNATITLNDGTDIKAEIVIGADGVWSTIAKKSGLCNQRPVTICIFQEYPLTSNTIDRFFSEKRLCHIFIKFQGMAGYGWVFPKKTHVNIGIYRFRLAAPPSKDRKNLKTLYKNYIAFLKENKIIPDDLKIGKVRGAALPISPLDKTYTDRVVLCGDAAGFISPATGEGIYYAMSSGQLAADVVAQALEAGDSNARFLSRYKTMWHHDFGKDIKLLLHASKRWGYNTEKFFRLAMSDKALSEVIFDIVTGQIGLHEYKWKIIRRYLYIHLMDLIGKGK